MSGEGPAGPVQPEDEVTAAGDLPAVLRYWLAMIRHEEALGRVLKVAMGTRREVPDLRQPSAGQAYVKLLPDALLAGAFEGLHEARQAIDDYLLRHRSELKLGLGGERSGFLEHTLAAAYRRETAARFGRDEGDGGTHVVGFPTLHLRSRGELATVLRFPVDRPVWRDVEDKVWSWPSYRQRLQAAELRAPHCLHLMEERDDESAGLDEELRLPYALDTHHASRTLGIPEEHVNRLLETLAALPDCAPSVMVAAVTALARGPDDAYPEEAVAAALQMPVDAEAAPLLGALHEAVAARPLPRGVKAWPVGLLWDASQAMTTRLLQQDLAAFILTLPGERSPLWSYLRGTPCREAVAVHVGLRGERSLTAAQREVADRAHAQRLTVAQGPPGTGKTELILNLAAHRVIEGVVGGEAKAGPMVIASTNNRAVDNAVDPLCRELPDVRLPLALRVGSFATLKEVTLPTLRRALAWLESRVDDAEGAAGRFRALQVSVRLERERLLEERRRLQEVGAAPRRLEALREKGAALRAEVEGLEAVVEGLADERREALLAGLNLIREFKDAADRERGRLAKVGQPSSGRLRRGWRKLTATRCEDLGVRLSELGCEPLEVVAPNGPDDWEEAFEALAAGLDGRARALTGGVVDEPLAVTRIVAKSKRAAEVDAEIASLEALVSQVGGEADAAALVRLDAAESLLFVEACEAREVWAASRAASLCDLLRALIRHISDSPNVFKQRLQDATVRAELFSLFPIVGCTLLSIGNTFPFEADVIDLVVIDEAGQCHPAYPVSALGRARRALVIGDPHQLEPVMALDEAEETRVIRRSGCTLSARTRAPFRANAEAGRSAQTLACRAARNVHVLRDHFRCQASIIAISDALCGYGLRVRTTGGSPASRSRHLPGPLILHDLRGEQRPQAGSWSNEVEVERVGLLVRALLRDGIVPGRIAVLTPYRGQLVALKARLKADRVPLDEDTASAEVTEDLFGPVLAEGVALGTVHRFQGGERDVVIFSTVVSRDRSLGFLNRKVNLVNVAVSRARLHLIIVGHREVLRRGEVTRALVDRVPAECVIGQ